MNFGSVCSGIEAASVAWHPLWWRAAWLAEIEPFPSAVLAHHYPDVPNLGDMTTISRRVLTGEVSAPDVFCGGTPCFTAGHMVITQRGYVPIEEIVVGDMVVTHKGRLRRVVRIGSKIARVGVPCRRDQTPGKLGRFGAALAGAGHSLQKASCRWLNARFTAKLKAGCSVPSSDIARSMAGYRTADAWESVGAAPQHPTDGPHFA